MLWSAATAQAAQWGFNVKAGGAPTTSKIPGTDVSITLTGSGTFDDVAETVSGGMLLICANSLQGGKAKRVDSGD
jgi:hypothetical protein